MSRHASCFLQAGEIRWLSTCTHTSLFSVCSLHDALFFGRGSEPNTSDIINHLTPYASLLGTCIPYSLMLMHCTAITWKLRIFNAILQSKILLGLKVSSSPRKTFPSPMLSKWRAFVEFSTFHLHSLIVQQLTKVFSTHSVTPITLTRNLLFHTWKTRKVKLLGHILRSSPLDPMRQVLFDYNSFTPRIQKTWETQTFLASRNLERCLWFARFLWTVQSWQCWTLQLCHPTSSDQTSYFLVASLICHRKLLHQMTSSNASPTSGGRLTLSCTVHD